MKPIKDQTDKERIKLVVPERVGLVRIKGASKRPNPYSTSKIRVPRIGRRRDG